MGDPWGGGRQLGKRKAAVGCGTGGRAAGSARGEGKGGGDAKGRGCGEEEPQELTGKPVSVGNGGVGSLLSTHRVDVIVRYEEWAETWMWGALQ